MPETEEETAPEEIGGIPQGRGKRFQGFILIGVAFIGEASGEIFPYARQSGSHGGRKGQVGIGVGTGHPIFDPKGITLA